jgi:hypothetical protein
MMLKGKDQFSRIGCPKINQDPIVDHHLPDENCHGHNWTPV